tara:strand:+ start:21437 stop:21697 length:261 start_codon:yes stop_codon:yes gene_type:complete
MSTSDLEIAWLRKTSGDSNPSSTLSDLRKQVYPNGEHPYWAATSGLTPAETFSLTDHKRAAMQVAVPSASGTMTDVERTYYAENLP